MALSDNSDDTELRIGRLTKNESDSYYNYIAFKDNSEERSMYFHANYFRFFGTTSFGRLSITENYLNSSTNTLRLSTEHHVVALTDGSLRPSEYNTGNLDLGNLNFRWGQLYATNSNIKLSDKNSKEQIQPISSKYEMLFDLIEPVTYKLKSSDTETHDRIHIGAVSQQVEDAMEKAELSAQELSFFCKDPNPENSGFRYALRYEEWIMLNTHMLQKTRRELQESRETITGLQRELADLKAAVKILQEVQ